MSEALQGREASIRGGRLLWSLLTVTFTVLAAAILHEGVQEMREGRAAHERCRERAGDLVEAAACSCILEREDGLFRHALVMFAPKAWQELWHRATRNECLAEAYTRTVTERGIQAVRPLPLSGTESGFSP